MWDATLHLFKEAIGPDLATFRNGAGLIRAVVRLILAAALGGLLGYERTIHRRPAGLRTYMLVSLGSASFVLATTELGLLAADLSRVVQGLMTGIGFLGAGVIVKSDEGLRTKGLTTAAGIWLTASVGMAVGMGQPAIALITTALALITLAPLRRVENRFDARRHRHAPRHGASPPDAQPPGTPPEPI